jgi:hypothetical protein
MERDDHRSADLLIHGTGGRIDRKRRGLLGFRRRSEGSHIPVFSLTCFRAHQAGLSDTRSGFLELGTMRTKSVE